MTVIVEHVALGSKAEQAGVRCGDRLLSYAGGLLTSPAMLRALEDNTFGPESVTLCGEREGQAQEWTLPHGESGAEVRPELPEAVLADYQRGRATFRAKEYAEAVRIWSDIAQQIPEKMACAWLYQTVGEAAGAGFDHQSGMNALTVACELAGGYPDTAPQALVWGALGRCREKLNEPDGARQWLDQARQSDEAAGRLLWVARDLNMLGNLACRHGDLSAARSHLLRAFDIGGRLAPGSPDVATSLNGLGIVAIHQNDLTSAHDHITRALSIQERLAPGSLDTGRCLNNLGYIAWRSGKITAAHDYFARALGIWERLAPDAPDVATCLSNLAGVALKRGDLAAAQDYQVRGLSILERRAPGSLLLALCLLGLGSVALDRGDLETARDWLTRALEIQKRLAPGNSETAAILNNLGNVALLSGETGAAREYITEALSIWERLGPGSLETGACLTNLGEAAFKSGDLPAAHDYLARALGVWERLAPGWPDHATTLQSLGSIAHSRHRPDEAVEYFRQAVEIIETQRAQLSTSEARALLLSQHIPKYAGLAQAYLALGDTGNAFHTLERARARSFVEMLAARALDMATDAAPELLSEQAEIDQQRGQAYNTLSQLTGADQDAGEVETLHRTLRELERRQQELAAQIRAASPRYAALQYPQPLTLIEAQAALEPGSLLLAYLVDDEQTFLFAVTATHAEAHALPVSREALQEQVRMFRQATDRNRLAHAPTREAALGRALYAALIRPVQAAVRRAERLLLCPDGPLHTLPFAALVTNTRGKPLHLGTQKPLSHILSMTTHAQARAARPQPAPVTPPRLVAFGDPLYSVSGRTSGPVAQSELSLLQTRGLSLAPLPHSRVEVEGLAQLYGADATVRLGAEATKKAVLREGGDTDLLHLACHAWFDPVLPLSSGLVLSRQEASEAEADDNGLLQAWEIFQLRLSADLVVLSACQSGLGQEMRGEGLIGLTRAFQYAGARSLVVSLWDVNDASTALFMQVFYGALQGGAGKDEALRQGTLALKADPRWDAPCYWAAFVLIGDRN